LDGHLQLRDAAAGYRVKRHFLSVGLEIFTGTVTNFNMLTDSKKRHEIIMDILSNIASNLSWVKTDKLYTVEINPQKARQMSSQVNLTVIPDV